MIPSKQLSNDSEYDGSKRVDQYYLNDMKDDKEKIINLLRTTGLKKKYTINIGMNNYLQKGN